MWFRLAEYPVCYAAGSTETDPIVCPLCYPVVWRPWNWMKLPYPRSSGIRLVYACDVPVGSVCDFCGDIRS